MRCDPSTRRLISAGAAILSLTLVIGQEAQAYDIVTTNPDLPPIGGGYTTGELGHASFPGADITSATHSVKDLVGRMNSGGNDIETIDSQLTGLVSVGGGTPVPFTLNGPVQIEVFQYMPGDLGTFQTQMLSMDLTGSVGGHSVEIMLDSALGSSTGQTTITSLGGGEFRISSFFDVFTELSIDSGPFQGQTNGPTMVSLTFIPEPSALVLWVSASIISLSYAAYRRRRKAGKKQGINGS
jgi:hypothetical protein